MQALYQEVFMGSAGLLLMERFNDQTDYGVENGFGWETDLQIYMA